MGRGVQEAMITERPQPPVGKKHCENPSCDKLLKVNSTKRYCSRECKNSIWTLKPCRSGHEIKSRREVVIPLEGALPMDDYKALHIGPVQYVSGGTMILDAEGNMMINIRAWGRLSSRLGRYTGSSYEDPSRHTARSTFMEYRHA